MKVAGLVARSKNVQVSVALRDGRELMRCCFVPTSWGP